MTSSKLVFLFPFLTHLFSLSAYKSSAADSLLAERGRIDSSHRMTDDILQYVPLLIKISSTDSSFSSGKRTRHVQSSLDDVHY